jgi:hypothetical protein
VFTDAAGVSAPASQPVAPRPPAVADDRQKSALEHDTVKHLLEVFPVEKTTVQGE